MEDTITKISKPLKESSSTLSETLSLLSKFSLQPAHILSVFAPLSSIFGINSQIIMIIKS